MDGWTTKPIILEGGLIQNQAPLVQGMNIPGSLIKAVNFEPGLAGGYRRLSGFDKYDPSQVPGTGPVLGVQVFEGHVLACRGSGVFKGVGLGWSQISTDNRDGAGKYRFAQYNWVAPTVVMVDGVNRPAKWNGSTYTVLSNAPLGATDVVSFKNHLFFAKGNKLTCSAPYDDTKYDGTAGSVEINVGRDIEALAVWRDELYIFSRSSIQKLTGTTYQDFVLSPVTANLGCVAGDTVQEVGGDLIYLGPDGLRTIAGTMKIGDVEIESISRQIQSRVNTIANSYANGSISAVVMRGKSQYRLFLGKADTADVDSIGLLGGIRLSNSGMNYEWFELRGIKAFCADSGYIGPEEVVLHGGYDGFVYRQERGNTFAGRPVQAFLQTPFIPYDDPQVRKTLYRSFAHIEGEGFANVKMSIVYDFDRPGTLQPDPINIEVAGGLSAYDTVETKYDDSPEDTYDPQIYPVYSLNLEGSGYNNSFVFWSEADDAPYTIKHFNVEYSLGGRS